MGLLNRVRDRVVGALAGAQVGGEDLKSLSETLDAQTSVLEAASTVKEAGLGGGSASGLAELALAEEDLWWRELTASYGHWNFNRATLRRICARSRLMYLVNPLIRRAVTVQELYVWGGGVEIKAEDPDVDRVIQDFFTDRKNQRVIGRSWADRERDQRIDGNQFFAIFRNRINGSARIRILPFDQIEDIVYNPQDSTEPWFYVRSPTAAPDILTGELQGTTPNNERILYPDIDYNPRIKPSRLDRGQYSGIRVEWNCCVTHIKSGGIVQMHFGLPELYSTFGWAGAYKRILENFSTILAAYARMAMKITGLAGGKQTAATKKKMNTAVNQGEWLDRNPPKNTAAWAAFSGNADVSAVKTSGSTTGPDEARALRSMVAAGSDTPEHFFGDSDVGNFATSTTLDRPTELKMVKRQGMWAGYIDRWCELLIEWSTAAPQGILREAGFRIGREWDDFDGSPVVIITPPEGKSLQVTATFPNILERDVTDRVRAVCMAATLNGSTAEGIVPDRKFLFKLLMVALGEKNAEYLTNRFYPESVTQGFIDPDNMTEDQKLAAQGKKELGDAALIAAKAQKTKAEQPPPAPAGPASGATAPKNPPSGMRNRK